MRNSTYGLLQTAVVDDDFQVHFRLPSQALNMCHVLALVGADGTSQGFVIRKDRAEAEGKNSGEFEAVADHAGVVLGCLLVQAFLGIVFGDDDCEITGWIKENLIS